MLGVPRAARPEGYLSLADVPPCWCDRALPRNRTLVPQRTCCTTDTGLNRIMYSTVNCTVPRRSTRPYEKRRRNSYRDSIFQ